MDIDTEELHALTLQLLELKDTEELANYRGKKQFA